MSLPRVLVLSPTAPAGDWASSRLIRSLFASWPSDHIATAYVTREGAAANGWAAESVSLDLAGQRNPRALFDARRSLRSLVDRFKPEVLYFYSSGWPASLDLLARELQRSLPSLVHVMDDWPAAMATGSPRRAQLGAGMLGQLLRSATTPVAISEPMASAFQQRFEIGPMLVAHGGIEPADVRHDRVQSTNRSPQTVLYSGTISDRQAAASLVDVATAVAELRTRGIDLVLEVAVPEQQLTEKRDEFERLGVQMLERVSASEYQERLARATVLLLPFNFDAESTAFLRYSVPQKMGDLLAAKRPVLVYGPSAIVPVQIATSGAWAAVVDKRSTADLQAALADLLENSTRVDSMIAAGQQELTERFSMPSTRKRFEDAIRAAVTQSDG